MAELELLTGHSAIGAGEGVELDLFLMLFIGQPDCEESVVSAGTVDVTSDSLLI